MEHVVFFPAHDGSPAFRRVSSLEEAVRLVEHLRNVEGVTELSVHSLTEVPLAFKAIYRVEVPTGEVADPAALEVPSQPPPLPSDPPMEAAVDLPVPALAVSNLVSNGHSEDAPSSLGFFAS